MNAQSISSAFQKGGLYGGDILSQQLRNQTEPNASRIMAGQMPESAGYSAMFSTGSFQKSMGFGGAGGAGGGGPQSNPFHSLRRPDPNEPEWININQMMVRDIITFLKNNATVHACVSVIPQRLLNKGFVWLGKLQQLNPAVKKAMNTIYKTCAEAAFYSAIEIGLIMIKTRPHDVLSEIPVVLNYQLHTPQFYITENDEYKWRVIRNSDGAVVEDVIVIEVYRPYPTGHLSSPMAMLLTEIYQDRFLRETFSFSTWHRAHPTIVLEHRRPNRSADGPGSSSRRYGAEPHHNVPTDLKERLKQKGVLGSTSSTPSIEEITMFQRVTRGMNTGNAPVTQEIAQAKLRDILDGPFRSHSVETDEDMRRTIFKTYNDFSYTQPTLPEVPPHFPELLELFEKICARIFHVPREVWADQHTRFKTSETLAHDVLQDTLDRWADVLENLFGPLLYKIYGVEAFFTTLFDQEQTIHSTHLTPKKAEKLRLQKEEQVQTFFNRFLIDDPSSRGPSNPPVTVDHPIRLPDKSKKKKKKPQKTTQPTTTTPSDQDSHSSSTTASTLPATTTSASVSGSASASTSTSMSLSSLPVSETISSSEKKKTKRKGKPQGSKMHVEFQDYDNMLGVKLGWRHKIEQEEEMKQRLSFMTATASKKQGGEDLLQALLSMQQQIHQLQSHQGLSLRPQTNGLPFRMPSILQTIEQQQQQHHTQRAMDRPQTSLGSTVAPALIPTPGPFVDLDSTGRAKTTSSSLSRQVAELEEAARVLLSPTDETKTSRSDLNELLPHERILQQAGPVMQKAMNRVVQKELKKLQQENSSGDSTEEKDSTETKEKKRSTSTRMDVSEKEDDDDSGNRKSTSKRKSKGAKRKSQDKEKEETSEHEASSSAESEPDSATRKRRRKQKPSEGT